MRKVSLSKVKGVLRNDTQKQLPTSGIHMGTRLFAHGQTGIVLVTGVSKTSSARLQLFLSQLLIVYKSLKTKLKRKNTYKSSYLSQLSSNLTTRKNVLIINLHLRQSGLLSWTNAFSQENFTHSQGVSEAEYLYRFEYEYISYPVNEISQFSSFSVWVAQSYGNPIAGSVLSPCLFPLLNTVILRPCTQKWLESHWQKSSLSNNIVEDWLSASLLYALWTSRCSGKPSLRISADWFQGWAVKVSVSQVDVKLPIDQKADLVINNGADILPSPSRKSFIWKWEVFLFC